MNSNDLISILMPTYNVGKYVDDAIRSILRQTYENFELIIVDDCSTDNTYERLEYWKSKDNRIKVFRNSKNLKISRTLNYALSSAKGNYIGRMDGDDICSPNRFSILYNYLKSHDNCDLVGSQVESINESSNVIRSSKLLQTHRFIKKYSKYQSTVLHIWLAKRMVYEKLVGYRDCPFVEDYDFLLRALKNGFTCSNVPDVLYRVRLRDGNTVSTNGIKQQRAKKYIYNCVKLDRPFVESEYISFISNYSKKDERKYIKSLAFLSKGLHTRNKFQALYCYFMASIGSKYVRLSIKSSFRIRLGVWLEGEKISNIDHFLE